jgi:hypothetical protein
MKNLAPVISSAQRGSISGMADVGSPSLRFSRALMTMRVDSM